MKCGILAAGRGERLRGTGVLKPLVQVAGRPLICHVLDAFTEVAPDEVVVIINDAAAGVRAAVEAQKWSFALRWIVETTPSSMHSFLRLAEELNPTDPVPALVSTVDTIVAPSVFSFFHQRSVVQRENAIALAVNEPAEDDNPLWVKVDGKRVTALGDAAKGSSIATAGLYAVRATVLEQAESARRDSIMSLRAFLARLLDRGYSLGAVRIAKSIDVDRHADIIAAEKFLQQTRP